MVHYRCYFFGSGASSFRAPNSIDSVTDLQAETDEEARARAQLLYSERRVRSHGYELWQGNRLIHRQLPSGAVADPQPPGSGGGRAGRYGDTKPK